MTDETSGNRWEAGYGADRTDRPDDATTPPTPTQAIPAADPVPERTPRLTRGRTAAAGVAAATLLVGGVGGFALGRVTADERDGDRVGFDQRGIPTGFDHDERGGFPGGVGGPGGGGPGGQLPDQFQGPDRAPDQAPDGEPGTGDGSDT